VRGAGSGRLAGLLLVVFVLSSVGIVSAREPNRPIGDGKPSPALSEKDPNWRAGIRRRDARAKRLAGPVEKRRRKASRTAFDDASRTGALALAKRELPELFDTPLFDGAVPAPGMRVVQQGGKGTAVVEDVKTGKRVVLQSNVPLQTDDGGTMAPVDLSLQTAGADLTSDNAFVPLRVDRTSSADVTFPESGFSVEVAGNAKDRLVQRSAGRLFFAETRPDTDALVTPTVMGAELGLVLRSAAAPERQVLDFDLPAGATLRRARVKDPIPGDPPGALQIRRDNKTIGYLGEPNVFDADGQGVRSRMAFRGDKVTIDVDHHGQDIRYPVFVDPEISVVGQFYSNWDGWGWSQALKEPRNYSLAEGYGATKNNCDYACGLYESHPTHHWNANGSYANWYYRAGRNTFIYRAVFGGTYHDGMLISGRNHTDAFQGVMNNAYNAWESMSFTNGQGYVGPNPYGPAEPSFANSTLNFCINLSACSQTGNLSEENYALFGLVTQNKFGCCAVDSGIYKGSTAMATANVYLGDRRNPTLTGGLPGDSPWHDDNDAVSTVSPRGRDDGLGLYSFTLSGAASGNGIQRVRSTNDPNQDCSGSPHYLKCPANGPEGTTTFGYRLNEGTTRLNINAQDAVDNATETHSWLERIDRSAPVVSSVSGSMFDSRNRDDDHRFEGLYGDSYTLRAEARDAHAGLRDIEVFMTRDGGSRESQRARGAYSTTGTLDWTMRPDDFADGDYLVEVLARDNIQGQAGAPDDRHTVLRTFRMTIDRRGDVYTADLLSGDPAQGGERLQREWLLFNTLYGRHEDDDRVATRRNESCPNDSGRRCDVVRERTYFSSRSDSPDAYDTWTGAPDDASVPDRLRLLIDRELRGRTPVATGTLSDALQPWQVAPPAHGAQFERYDIAGSRRLSDPPAENSAEDADGYAPQDGPTTLEVFLDRLTRLPVRLRVVTDAGEVIDDGFWSYSRERRFLSDYSADLFVAPRPGNEDGQRTEVDQRGQQPTGEVQDRQTRSVYRPWFLGSTVALAGIGQACLRQNDVIDHSKGAPNTADVPPGDSDPSIPGALPVTAETEVTSSYNLLDAGRACVGSVSNAERSLWDLEVVTMASGSTNAETWRTAFREDAEAAQLAITDPDQSRGGLQPVLFELPRTAYVVPAGPDRLAALFDTGNTTLMITGIFNKTQLQTIIDALRKQ